MAHTIPTWSTTPVPGGWLFHSRIGVAQLARCATLDDVRSRFGSARTLTEQLLGFPLNGGHATEPMVQLVGELLHHRLGPAVAAEALALLVEIQQMVPTNTIERILRRYLDVSVAAGLPTETELSELVGRLDEVDGRARSALAVDLCQPQGREKYARRETTRVGWGEEIECDFRPSRFFGNPLSWSGEGSAGERFDRSDDILRRFHTAELVDLSDHDQTVKLLWDNTDLLLYRHDCPDELRALIRHPYNEATLHLAIRAGRPFYETSRVRRMLLGAPRPSLERIAEHSLHQLAVAVMHLGLMAEQRLQWLLTTIDSAVWRQALPACGTLAAMQVAVRQALEDTNTPPALVAALLLETPVLHARFGQVALLDDGLVGQLLLHPEMSVRVAAAGHVHSAWPDAAAVAALSADMLAANDDGWLEGALRSDHPWVVAVAVDRSAARGLIVEPFDLVCDAIDVAPRVNPDLVRASAAWQPLVAGTPAVVHVRRTPNGSSRHRAYRYPKRVLCLDGASLPGRPGWMVTVPVDRHELLANATIMGNCSGYFHQRIQEGESFLLIINGPAGQRCNAALASASRGFEIFEIKDRFNTPAPEWMEAALWATIERSLRPVRHISMASNPVDAPPKEPPTRHRKPRRRPGGDTRRRPPTRPSGR